MAQWLLDEISLTNVGPARKSIFMAYLLLPRHRLVRQAIHNFCVCPDVVVGITAAGPRSWPYYEPSKASFFTPVTQE